MSKMSTFYPGALKRTIHFEKNGVQAFSQVLTCKNDPYIQVP